MKLRSSTNGARIEMIGGGGAGASLQKVWKCANCVKCANDAEMCKSCEICSLCGNMQITRMCANLVKHADLQNARKCPRCAQLQHAR
jgi:hypothetical protein